MKNIYKVNEEAVKKIAERVYDNGSTVINRNDLEEMFPELESEGERIELLNYLYDVHDDDEERARWIAWLEKQNEQKPADKVEPKFKVGDKVKSVIDGFECTIESIDNTCYYGDTTNFDIQDQDGWELVEQKPADKIEPKFHKGEWIVHHGTENIYQVVAVIDNQYQLKYGDNYTVQKCADVDRCTRLWTIQNARDGDVLAAHECLVLFKEIDGLNIRCYCTYHYLNHQAFYVDTLQNKTAFHPATKEQRELLFQKMKEAGYEWDSEKKELKKIENEIEIPFGAKDSELQEATYYIPKSFHAEIDDDKVVIKKGEKPAAWSDEDEKIISDIHCFLDYRTNCHLHDQETKERAKKIVSWLDELKDRVQPKPKQEWSDEDEKIVTELIGIFESAVDGGNVTFPYRLVKDYIRVLKSCLLQNTWKPSDLPHWKKSTLPNDNATGFNSDFFLL